MLSRVAESLFWIGRYVERAENTARILDVAFRSSREFSAAFARRSAMARGLTQVLWALGIEDDYMERFPSVTEDHLIQYLVLDTANSASILSCLTQARENARSVRESISTEMWEEINRSYYQLARSNSTIVLIDGINEFCRQIKLASQLFHGVTDATMAYDEAWHFLQLGKYLERAGATARVLAAHAPQFAENVDDTRPEEVHRWLSLLRSVSAYEAYYRLVSGGVQPADVASFLLLDERFPRSVYFCVRRMTAELEEIEREIGAGRRDGPADLAGALASRLRYTRFEQVGLTRVEAVATDIVEECARLGGRIESVYFQAAFAEPV